MNSENISPVLTRSSSIDRPATLTLLACDPSVKQAATAASSTPDLIKRDASLSPVIVARTPLSEVKSNVAVSATSLHNSAPNDQDIMYYAPSTSENMKKLLSIASGLKESAWSSSSPTSRSNRSSLSNSPVAHTRSSAEVTVVSRLALFNCRAPLDCPSLPTPSFKNPCDVDTPSDVSQAVLNANQVSSSPSENPYAAVDTTFNNSDHPALKQSSFGHRVPIHNTKIPNHFELPVSPLTPYASLNGIRVCLSPSPGRSIVIKSQVTPDASVGELSKVEDISSTSIDTVEIPVSRSELSHLTPTVQPTMDVIPHCESDATVTVCAESVCPDGILPAESSFDTNYAADVSSDCVNDLPSHESNDASISLESFESDNNVLLDAREPRQDSLEPTNDVSFEEETLINRVSCVHLNEPTDQPAAPEDEKNDPVAAPHLNVDTELNSHSGVAPVPEVHTTSRDESQETSSESFAESPKHLDSSVATSVSDEIVQSTGRPSVPMLLIPDSTGTLAGRTKSSVHESGARSAAQSVRNTSASSIGKHSVTRNIRSSQSTTQSVSAKSRSNEPSLPPSLLRPMSIVLPGDRISVRMREAHRQKLLREQEEERRRRAFKARPIPKSVIAGPSPNLAVRKTLTSRAREDNATSSPRATSATSFTSGTSRGELFQNVPGNRASMGGTAVRKVSNRMSMMASSRKPATALATPRRNSLVSRKENVSGDRSARDSKLISGKPLARVGLREKRTNLLDLKTPSKEGSKVVTSAAAREPVRRMSDMSAVSASSKSSGTSSLRKRGATINERKNLGRLEDRAKVANQARLEAALRDRKASQEWAKRQQQRRRTSGRTGETACAH